MSRMKSRPASAVVGSRVMLTLLFRSRRTICQICQCGGFDIRFSIAVSSYSECQIPNHTANLLFAGGPSFLTFVNGASATGYECQKRATSPKEGFSYMGFLLYTRSLSRQIPNPPC